MRYEHTRCVGDEFIVCNRQIAGGISIDTTAIRAGSKDTVASENVLQHVAELSAGVHQANRSSGGSASTSGSCRRNCTATTKGIVRHSGRWRMQSDAVKVPK